MAIIKAPGTYSVRVINADAKPWLGPEVVQMCLERMANGTDCSTGSYDETSGVWTIAFQHGAGGDEFTGDEGTVVGDLRLLAEDGAVAVEAH